MHASPVRPSHDPHDPSGVESSRLYDQMLAVRAQVIALRQDVAELRRQLSALYDLVAQRVRPPDTPDGTPGSERPAVAALTEEIVAACARDVVAVLREAGRPLTLLEILNELVRRQLSWRENTVRHALDELLDRGTIARTDSQRPDHFEMVAAR
jgi:hypothetical protein